MISIWKYELDVRDSQTLLLPLDAEILSVGLQRGVICLWAKVDTEVEGREIHEFRIVGTGHPVPRSEESKFLGTVIMDNVGLVFHVFEDSITQNTP